MYTRDVVKEELTGGGNILDLSNRVVRNTGSHLSCDPGETLENGGTLDCNRQNKKRERFGEKDEFDFRHVELKMSTRYPVGDVQ